ncbi:MAG: MarR family winged helix-turn-helix transcriptional regulator [Sarcina sp.]
MEEKNNEDLYFELKKMMKNNFYRSRKVIEEYGLYVGQPQFLFTLYKEEGLRQKDIAEKLEIQAPTVTVTVKRLEKSGFITKSVDEKNKRVSRLYLTEKGRKACEELQDVMRSVHDEIFSVLTGEEKNKFKELLIKINTRIDEENNK